MTGKPMAEKSPCLPKRAAYRPFRQKVALVLVAGAALALLTCCDAAAGDQNRTTQRIESSYSIERLSPDDPYGMWHTGNLAYFNRPRVDFTWFTRGSFHNRPEGNGVLGVLGAYKDWTESFYTYSSIAGSTRTLYLPRFRLDHDMNFKIGATKSCVLTFGVTYIDYFTVHRDLIFSGGTTLFFHPLIFQYRFFFNESKPGSIRSNSHLFSASYGREGWQWTSLTLSFGNQAYLATAFAVPEAVNQDSLDIAFHHRRWLGRNYGLFGSTGYFKLKDGYDKYTLSLGVFYEF